MNRRDVLTTGAAVAAIATASPVLPPIVEKAIEQVAPPPAWIVGTDGEFDWQHVTGCTPHEAILNYLDEVWQIEWKCETAGTDQPGCPDNELPCEFCERYRGLDYKRMPKWDGLRETTPADWIRAGMGAFCDRCGEETGSFNGAWIVPENGKDQVVCEECMTLADYDQVDPKRAAELREIDSEWDCDE
jgi:hypothetical protein